LLRRLFSIGLAAGTLVLAATAHGELVEFDNLVLTADGGFTPRTLPRRAFAPIEFKGRANLRAIDGGVPVAVQRIVLGFDRDGRLDTRGLRACDPALLIDATPAQARAACARSIVGEGRVVALVARDDGPPLKAASPLTIFNGPREAGHPTAILHARLATPAAQTFVLTVPIEKRPGEFRYRATLDIPPIAAGRVSARSNACATSSAWTWCRTPRPRSGSASAARKSANNSSVRWLRSGERCTRR